METKEIKAKVSSDCRKFAIILIVIYEIYVVMFGGLGFLTDGGNYWWFFIDTYGAGVAIPILLMVVFAALPFIILLLINRRKRLTTLTVNEKEVIGTGTDFWTVSKYNVKIRTEKIDSFSVEKNIFYWFTGKTVIIRAASGVFKIKYVLNADEILAFISNSIEKFWKS